MAEPSTHTPADPTVLQKPDTSSTTTPPHTTNNTTKPSLAPDQDQDQDPDSDSDLDALLEDTDSPALAALQSARLSELQSQSAAAAKASSTSNPAFSRLTPYSHEKPAMHTIAASSLSILLFTHPSFPLCKVMASHLDRIANLTAAQSAGGNVEAENITWLSLEAEKAPFLTDKLRIRVLPAVVGYRDGEEVGRLVGFEGMPGRAAREGGWKIVIRILRGWGVVGNEEVAGEDEGSEGEDEEEEGAEEGMEVGGRRDGGRFGNWIGGQKSNARFSTRGTGKGAREDDTNDDDDWE